MTGLRSLGLRTDLMVMEDNSVLEDRGAYLILRTPAEPTFWYGNCLIYRQPAPVAEMVAQFRAAFPDARHICLCFDTDAPGPGAEDLAALGLKVEKDDVLTAHGPLANAPVPEGYAIRPIGEDWDQLVAAQHRIGLEEHGEGGDHLAYVTKRFDRLRLQIAAGKGQWFGAFRGDELAADLGIMVGGGLARYQSVETLPEHRRRGLCAALVGHAGRWARAGAAPDLPLVIVAEAGGDAGRVYRRCGFSLTEQTVSAYSPGY